MPRTLVAVQEQLDARCLACRYALRGLPRQSRCPECGRAFDLDDPWTVWLPGRPNWLVRFLLRAPTRAARLFPIAAVVSVAWGARVPGWSHPSLHLAILLAIAGFVSIWLWTETSNHVDRLGYPTQTTEPVRRRWRRDVSVALVAVFILLVLRPTMLLSAWISLPWFDRHARWVLAQPFQVPAHAEPAVRGVYYVRGVRRCPHGVKLFVGDDWNGYDASTGFFYRSAPGECHRFHEGVPLGGGWYASP